MSEDRAFKVFTSAVENGGEVKAINVKGAASKYSRKDIDALTEFAAIYGAKGLAWLKSKEEGLKGPIAKFFEGEVANAISEHIEAEAWRLIIIRSR